jgi:DNA replication protein DnaC
MERPSDEEIERRIEQLVRDSEARGAAEKGLSIESYREWRKEEDEKRRVANEAIEEDKRARLVATKLEEMDIPARTLRSLDAIPLHTEALAAISKQTDILVLSGGPGCGKSVAAAFWLVFNSISSKEGALWSAGYWVTAASLSRGYAYDQEAFSKLTKKHALVIDDLGTEYQDQKERYLATLAEIVETRFAREKITLITTNLGPVEFKARYGERLADRIREDGAFVECGTTSLRRKRSE